MRTKKFKNLNLVLAVVNHRIWRDAFPLQQVTAWLYFSRSRVEPRTCYRHRPPADEAGRENPPVGGVQVRVRSEGKSCSWGPPGHRPGVRLDADEVREGAGVVGDDRRGAHTGE